MQSILLEILGFVGAIFLMYAYFQASRGRWLATSKAFQTCNVIAAVLLITYSGFKFAYANVLINLIWLVIGLLALWRLFRTKVS
ncbi:hypothetical protein H7Y40_02285 [Pedobacter sp.]|nr:hypothetical protein [Candidatus Saccharibacteria bacterium]